MQFEKLKNIAIVGRIGHSGNDIDMPGSEGAMASCGSGIWMPTVSVLVSATVRQLAPKSDPALRERIANRMSLGVPGVLEPVRLENTLMATVRFARLPADSATR